MNQQDKDRLRASGLKAMDGDAWHIARFHGYCEPSAILSLLEENEALARDAGRYRWLRDQADYMRVPEGSPQVVLTDEWGEIVSLLPSAYPRGEKLDSAIDAAMQPKGE